MVPIVVAVVLFPIIAAVMIKRTKFTRPSGPAGSSTAHEDTRLQPHSTEFVTSPEQVPPQSFFPNAEAAPPSYAQLFSANSDLSVFSAAHSHLPPYEDINPVTLPLQEQSLSATSTPPQNTDACIPQVVTLEEGGD